MEEASMEYPLVITKHNTHVSFGFSEPKLCVAEVKRINDNFEDRRDYSLTFKRVLEQKIPTPPDKDPITCQWATCPKVGSDNDWISIQRDCDCTEKGNGTVYCKHPNRI